MKPTEGGSVTSRKFDPTELARKDLIDMVRTRVRLEHRIAMRRELNEVEAAILSEFDDRVANAKPHELTYADVDALYGARKNAEASG